MGLGILSRSSESTSSPPPAPNPNPFRFQVLSVIERNGFFLAEVQYVGCTTYEGRKLIIINQDPTTRSSLDPHFTPEGYVIARFQPTVAGRRLAIATLNTLAADDY